MYMILDFGFWYSKLAKIFCNLRSLSMEVPCIYFDSLAPSMKPLNELQTLSLGYRILSKDKDVNKIDLLLQKLNPNKITGLFFGDCVVNSDEDFKKRFEVLSKLTSLQNMTIAVTYRKISNEMFEYLCSSLLKLVELRRFSCRLEKAVIDSKDWGGKLKKTFYKIQPMSWGFVSCQNGKVTFVRDNSVLANVIVM